jgi:hypothetical protein
MISRFAYAAPLAVMVAGCGGRIATGDLADAGPNGGGPGGGGAPGAEGGNPPRSGSGTACWSGQLPEVPPKKPAFSVADACMHAANDRSWSAANVHGMDAGVSKNPGNPDARAFLVGRWESCTAPGTDGIEFGANGRWRLLSKDAAGVYLPASTNPPTARGFYKLLAQNAQLDLRDDTASDRVREGGTGRYASVLVEALSSQEAMRWNGVTGQPFPPGPYARAEPSPSNGWDNPPSLMSGTCSLVGTWDTVPVSAFGGDRSDDISHQQIMPASFSFDDAGNFVAAPGVGIDLCVTHPMYGTYDLSLEVFQFTTNVGLGRCSVWSDAAYLVSFSADCTSMSTIMNRWDNCTGGRGYFNSPTTLVRRR